MAMKLLLESISDLTNEELERTIKQRGYFKTERDGHSIIEEEIDEVKEAFTVAQENYEMFWDYLKEDNLDLALTMSMALQEDLCRVAAEAIQAAAMCKKFRYIVSADVTDDEKRSK